MSPKLDDVTSVGFKWGSLESQPSRILSNEFVPELLLVGLASDVDGIALKSVAATTIDAATDVARIMRRRFAVGRDDVGVSMIISQGLSGFVSLTLRD